ncbi:FAD binding domain protein [Annulohypoxylon truncatum]|uniref:FAD binding domain protein n=1 Tax=Annulohypoxylon truncatum TaxID=327061 RepID=UPI00200897AB|nr:FAD binding domain protein [Annulohypoxylon truncatum]KAI1208281.1 FAD binding domain protein [Annulohypoxylon truncatum]
MTANGTQNRDKPANFQLHLIIIGAGLAGLAAAISTRLEGHRVTVLEKVSKLEEIGAGLQVTPNASRLFHHWGVYDELSTKAAIPTYLAVRRYDGTRLLSYEEHFQKKVLERYNAPFWDIHRADLQEALVNRAKFLGVEIRLGADVQHVDFKRAAVTTQDGRTVQGDLILGADGLWSRTRSFLLGRQLSPKPTGDLAYRIILNLEEVQDPELRELIAKPSVNLWIGPESHVVGYSLRQGKTYNLVLLRPDDLPEDVSRAAADVDEMRKLFEPWDPILSKLLACVNQVDKWRLMHISTLDAWVNDEGTFLMAGDACHPMLPYLAQGANSSLEDGAVLGRLLKYVTSRDKLTPALEMYQQLRKIRGEGIAKEALGQRDSFHLPDGPEQEQRDALLLEYLGKEPPPHFPSRWSCPSVQPWLWGYDAIVEADKAYETHPF